MSLSYLFSFLVCYSIRTDTEMCILQSILTPYRENQNWRELHQLAPALTLFIGSGVHALTHETILSFVSIFDYFEMHMTTFFFLIPVVSLTLMLWWDEMCCLCVFVLFYFSLILKAMPKMRWLTLQRTATNKKIRENCISVNILIPVGKTKHKLNFKVQTIV